MRIEERRATFGQRIEVRRLGQRMATQVTDPVVLVVDGDEDDVGPFSRLDDGYQHHHQQHAMTPHRHAPHRSYHRASATGVVVPGCMGDVT